ncbi:MAG: EAL domain-containing response regulator [Gammaproteobacteria bacterium]|nr:EAL domain-containing response regulator [Gammaproteobacteria bacterium]
MNDPTHSSPASPVVLVIDDDADFLAFACNVIDGLGFQSLQESTASAGLARAIEAAPTAILLDLQMPGCDGIETLRALGEAGCRATVILASGFDGRVLHTAEQVGRDNGLTMGGYLQKPLDLDAFEKSLRDAVRGNDVLDEADLERGIANGELVLHYQPKINLHDDRAPANVEALVRWQHPRLGLLYPDRIIPLAERGDLMAPLTRAVVDQALDQVAAWEREGFTVRVAVNIPPELLEDLELPEHLVELAEARQVSLDRLVLEVVETSRIDDNCAAMDVLTRLRLKDVGLAIDDFGTGHSSLLNLYRLPFSELKVDRSFVFRLIEDPEAQAIVGASIDLAHNLRMEACVEGVENEAVLERVRALGADSVQGFHFSRPLPAEKVLPFYREFPERDAVAEPAQVA